MRAESLAFLAPGIVDQGFGRLLFSFRHDFFFFWEAGKEVVAFRGLGSQKRSRGLWPRKQPDMQKQYVVAPACRGPWAGWREPSANPFRTRFGFARNRFGFARVRGLIGIGPAEYRGRPRFAPTSIGIGIGFGKVRGRTL
eukprot:gene16262-biopygen6729